MAHKCLGWNPDNIKNNARLPRVIATINLPPYYKYKKELGWNCTVNTSANTNLPQFIGTHTICPKLWSQENWERIQEC